MQKIYKSKDSPGRHRTVEGIEAIDKVIEVEPRNSKYEQPALGLVSEDEESA
jgi:hypothetical protein